MKNTIPDKKNNLPDCKDLKKNNTDVQKIDFLHAALCQLGMPRSFTESRIFERTSGSISLCIEAGRIRERGAWVDQPLPYGTKPRLIMVYLSGEAVRTGDRRIEIKDSIRVFLQNIGIDTSGGAKGGYTMFKKQIKALAACKITIGISSPGMDITVNTQPISKFEVWIKGNNKQQGLYPAYIELSHEFYETLIKHAVPLDRKALSLIKHNSTAIDIYTWLSHRLYRIEKSVYISWQTLKMQFGQEYVSIVNFKREFRKAMNQVISVYPEAKIESVTGGLLLKTSLPPVSKASVFISK